MLKFRFRKLFKSKKLQNTNTTKNLYFLTLDVDIVFIKLRQIFIKVLIFQYFDLKYYIQIATNILSYTIRYILD